MYIIIPIKIPIKRYALNSPSLNLNIAEIIKLPDISQKEISSIYVKKLLVLNFFLSILNMSNMKLIIVPKTINIQKL